jgi:hypothetical protein
MSPWTRDQPVAKPLPKHRTTQTQNKHIHIPNIHALCGIRTHDPGFRASEDSTCQTRTIHIRVWLASPARRGAGLGLISPHTYERGDPHTDEFGSLNPSQVGLASQIRTCMGPVRPLCYRDPFNHHYLHRTRGRNTAPDIFIHSNCT